MSQTLSTTWHRSLLLPVLLFLTLLGSASRAQQVDGHVTELMSVSVEVDPTDSSDIADSTSSWSVGGDFLDIGHTIGCVVTSPLRWTQDDLLVAGGFALTTAGAFLLDDEVRDLMRRNRSPLNDQLEPVGYSYGAPQYAAPGTLILYLTGAIIDNQWLRETGLMATEAIAIVGLLQIPTRMIAGRSRPFTGESNTSFKLFDGVNQERASFISGHTAIAFGAFTVLARQIDNPYATAGLYSIAALTPFVRLYADAHWFSDVVIGTALGVFIGNAVVDLHKGDDGTGAGLLLLPAPDGIMLTYRF